MSDPPKDTLREAFADAADFVADLVTDGSDAGEQPSGRAKFAKGLRTAGTVARKIPSPEEAGVAWDSSPLGRLERKLRERGVIRDRVADTDHLRRGGSGGSR